MDLSREARFVVLPTALRISRSVGASIAIDETTRERAAYVCADFVRHAGLAVGGRTSRFDVFALPLR